MQSRVILLYLIIGHNTSHKDKPDGVIRGSFNCNYGCGIVNTNDFDYSVDFEFAIYSENDNISTAINDIG